MPQDYQSFATDVLVLGAGGAGCQAALAAADAGARVVLVEKGRLGLSGSTFDPFTPEKGIIVAAKGFNPTDDPEVHFREAMAAARGLADPALVKAVAYDAPARFRELLERGFDFTPNRLSACFGQSMVGAFIDQRSLAAAFRRQIEGRGIRLVERTMAVGLLSDGERCAGAVGLTWDGDILVWRARAVVLATGGASTMFRYSLNTPALTGDGHMLALQAGAQLTNLEFYQAILGTTSPVRVYFPQWYLAGNPPLTNAQGHRFLPDYLPPGTDAAELVVARSSHGPFSFSRPSGWVDITIDSEIQAGRGTAAWGDQKQMSGVYCDFSSLPAEQQQALDQRSARPALAWLRARGLDVAAQPIPIAPFAHAFNGGIVIDEHGRTSVPGLYACGEVAAGPHGANRVGGHMFAVLLVFGARAGKHAARWANESSLPALDRQGLDSALGRVQALRSRAGEIRPLAVRRAIQQAMSAIMIAKDEARLRTAIAVLSDLKRDTLDRVGLRTRFDLIEALSVANLLNMALILARAALYRQETRGPHYRTDYPQERDEVFGENLLWRMERGSLAHRWASLAKH